MQSKDYFSYRGSRKDSGGQVAAHNCAETWLDGSTTIDTADRRGGSDHVRKGDRAEP
jgi:hypothetical protein